MNIVRNVLGGMLVVMLLVVSGCSDAGNLFAARLGEVAVQQAVVSGVRNEIEGPRGTTVNVTQHRANNSRQQNNQTTYYDGKMSDGSYYKGQILNRHPHGFGTRTWTTGWKYVGQFRNGKREGQGTEYGTNGTFVGEMKNGRAYKGTFTGKDGTIITGIFGEGTKSGTIIYPDGRKYEGEWNGDPEFLGTAGTMAPGSWSYERPHGIGKMIFPDGTIKEGIWNKGKFLGKLVKDG